MDGIRQIKRDFIVGPLSNGTTALLVDMAKAAGSWDVILGPDISRAYKPTRMPTANPPPCSTSIREERRDH